MAKNKPLKFRIFVGDRPIEELTEEEREIFSNKVVERMGNALNDYFSAHPEDYIAVFGKDDENAGRNQQVHTKGAGGSTAAVPQTDCPAQSAGARPASR